MNIVGKVPDILNVAGGIDYYDVHLVNILRYFSKVVDPQPGDIAIYTLNSGLFQKKSIEHTGFVVENGYIESKWGIEKVIFRHPVWHVPSVYGNNVVYMRPNSTGQDLLDAVKKRLSHEHVKERYHELSLRCHKRLFDNAAHRSNAFTLDKNYYANNVYELLERNMNVCVDQPDEEGRTALMLTVAVGDKACARLLLRYGANINHKDNNGDTALALAIKKGHFSLAVFLAQFSLVAFLAKCSAGKTIRNVEGKTAYDCLNNYCNYYSPHRNTCYNFYVSPIKEAMQTEKVLKRMLSGYEKGNIE